jgi:hypothetical protein
VKTIKFITWDEKTDGIAVEVDGREVWRDTAHDGWDQFFRHHMPRGVPVLLDSDTRPSERGQAADDPRPYPAGEDTFSRLQRWLVDNTGAYEVRASEEDDEGRPVEIVGPVLMDGPAMLDLLYAVAERFYWHGADDVNGAIAPAGNFEGASLTVILHPDQFCALCGADAETDETLVAGFLDVVVMTPAAGPALKKVCDACAAILRQQL